MWQGEKRKTVAVRRKTEERGISLRGRAVEHSGPGCHGSRRRIKRADRERQTVGDKSRRRFLLLANVTKLRRSAARKVRWVVLGTAATNQFGRRWT